MKIRLFNRDKKIKQKLKTPSYLHLKKKKKNPNNILVKISLQHLSKNKIGLLRIKQKLLKQYPFLEPLFST